MLLAGCAAPTKADKLGAGPTVVNWDLTTAQIHSSCSSRLALARRQIAALAAARGPATFSNSILALENIASNLSDDLTAQTFLSQVALSSAVRDESLACSNSVAGFFADATSNPQIYARLLQAQKTMSGADAADRALASIWVSQFELSGAGLAGAPRAEFVSLSKQLTEIQNRFNQNFANDTTTIQITKAETKGLAPDFVGSLKTSSDGSFIVPVNDSTSQPFLGSAASEAARERFYFAYGKIQAGPNVALLEHAITIRYRLARLLGMPSWAAYQMRTRTVQDPAKIVGFLQSLDAHVLPGAYADIAALQKVKRIETGDPHATIKPWDVAYYLNERTRAEFSLDQNEVRQYFPAPHTVSAIMSFYQHILGVTFAPIVPAHAWSPDVTEFSVTDTASGRFIGSFFLDLYPRAGKPGGAFNAPVISVRTLEDGQVRPPVSAMIVSDWPAPSKDKPALLRHDDVVVFFHEFGHCMAAMLANVPYESLSQFDQDFVEAPSQMLENFAWDRSILRRITSNVDTGQAMPDALIDKLLASRCVTDRLCNAYAASRQLMLSLIDLDYHMSGPTVDTTAVWAKHARNDTPIPTPAGVHPEAQFTHETSGYDAGYYVYMWSLVYAQDMFTLFQREGVDSADAGMRYRTTILEPARTYSPDDEVKRFLGRPMSTAAFYRGFNGS